MTSFTIVGQVGTVQKKEQMYAISIAENTYRGNGGEKSSTIWLKCICKFKPTCRTGDTVIAEGSFVQSKNENFDYALMIQHIGIIKFSDK